MEKLSNTKCAPIGLISSIAVMLSFYSSLSLGASHYSSRSTASYGYTALDGDNTSSALGFGTQVFFKPEHKADIPYVLEPEFLAKSSFNVLFVSGETVLTDDLFFNNTIDSSVFALGGRFAVGENDQYFLGLNYEHIGSEFFEARVSSSSQTESLILSESTNSYSASVGFTANNTVMQANLGIASINQDFNGSTSADNTENSFFYGTSIHSYIPMDNYGYSIKAAYQTSFNTIDNELFDITEYQVEGGLHLGRQLSSFLGFRYLQVSDGVNIATSPLFLNFSLQFLLQKKYGLKYLLQEELTEDYTHTFSIEVRI